MPPESSYQLQMPQERERQAALSAKKKPPADKAGVEVIQAIQKTTSAVTSGADEPERSNMIFAPTRENCNDDGHGTMESDVFVGSAASPDKFEDFVGNAVSRDVITVVRDPSRPLGKQFTLQRDGSVKKKAVVTLTEGIAVMHRVRDGDSMKALLLAVANDSHSAIIPSVFKGIAIGEEFVILSEAELEKRLQVKGRAAIVGVHQIEIDGELRKVAGRLKENILPSSWQLLDRDIDEHTPPEHASDNFYSWLRKLNHLLPGVSCAELVHSPSTSSRVLHDDAPIGLGNGHVWVQFANPDDVERVRVAVTVRAIQCGLSWSKPKRSRKTGEIVGHVPNTIIDTSVLTPGRLVFVGKPTVVGGLEVVPPQIRVIRAPEPSTLNSALAVLPESTQIAQITRAAGCEMHVSSDGSSMRLDAFDLRLDSELDTKEQGIVTVQDAIAQRKTMRCQAPFRVSESWAGKLNFSRATGRPFVHDVGTGVNHWLNQDEWQAVRSAEIVAEFDVVELSPAQQAETALQEARNRARAAGDVALPTELVDIGDDEPALPAVNDRVVLEVPDSFPEPFPGPMALTVEAALACAPKRQPVLTTLAVMVGMAAACTGVYRLPGGMRLNLYGVGVAQTGAGKELPRKAGIAIAEAAGAVVMGKAGSGQGLEDALVSRAGMLSEVDEIAHTLAAVNSSRAPGHLMELASNLLKLFSASSSTYRTRVLAKGKNSSPPREVKNPCLSLLGFATPQTLGTAVSSANIADGLLGRVLFAFGAEGVVPCRVLRQFDLPEGARAAADKIQHTLAALEFGAGDPVIEISIASDASNRLDLLLQELAARADRGTSAFQVALHARSYEKLERVAGVLAVWDNPAAPFMELRHIDWAARLVEASDSAMLRFTSEFMHESQGLANAALVLDVVRRVLNGTLRADRDAESRAVKRGWAPRSLVLRRTKMMKFDLERTVEHLQATGDLVVGKATSDADKGGQREVVLYKLRERV